MAIDNLNLYRQGLPAGHQTDKYSANPWFVFSKNADIFSSSNSFKATAWSWASQVDEWVVDIDPTWRFELHSDCRVYDTLEQEYVTWWSMNLWVINQINYGSWNEDPSRWKPIKLIVKRDNRWIQWKTIVVVTSTIVYTYFNESFKPTITLSNPVWCTINNWVISVSWDPSTIEFDVSFDEVWYFYWALTMIKKEKSTGTPYWDLTINEVKAYYPNLYYNTDDNDRIDYAGTWYSQIVTHESTDKTYFWIEPTDWTFNRNITAFYIPWYAEWTAGTKCSLHVKLNNVKEDDWGTEMSFNWTLEFDVPSDFYVSSYTAFLPPYLQRKVKEQYSKEEAYVISNVYTALVYMFEPVEWRYNFVEESELPWRSGEEFADMVVTDEVIYRFWNKRGFWVISKASVDDPAWENAITTTYPWIKFIGAVRYNDLIYIIADDRWISWLYAYNGSELVKIISWKEIRYERNYIEKSELFRFNLIEMWRDNILIGTDDWRVFMYWNTYWWKGLAVIYEGESWETIEWFTLAEESLSLSTKIWNTYYFREYLWDKAIKNYKQEFEVVLPMIVWNHFIEKEIYDLHTSFILPSSNCSIEYWICANHYHFWTFICTTNREISQKDDQWNIIQYTVDWFEWEYYFKFIEQNGHQYTFELVWDLPIQINTTNKISYEWWTSLTFTSFNHFRKLISFSAEWYTEKFERITNINNKLDLPRTHSLQVMVKWYWTPNYTPEVFSINLVSNQRDRW